MLRTAERVQFPGGCQSRIDLDQYEVEIVDSENGTLSGATMICGCVEP
jgi:hypothetical protein